jgi:hypothetical protein
MDSDEEYEDSDPDFDEEQEGYTEFETMLNNSSETNNIRNGLLKEKMELLLKFNSNKPGNYILDPELYRSNLNEINERLNELEVVTEDLTNELVDKEIEFVDLLDKYISKSKEGIKLTPLEVNKIKALNYLIDTLRENYNSQNKPFEPEEIVAHTWEEFEELEVSELKNIINRLKLKIKVPEEKNFKSKEAFDIAWKNFFNLMIPYLPIYETKINPTSIGTVTELISSEPLFLKVKEDLNEVAKSSIKLTSDDIIDIEKFKNLQNRLMSLEKSDLIDCIQNSNVKIPKSYIDELRNKKIKIVKYEQNVPSTSREPGNLKHILISVLQSLGERNLTNLNIDQLEELLNTKYFIPPSVYFKKTFKQDTIIEGSHPITLNYNSRTPIVIVKKYPVPKDTEISNENYYQTYLPIPDSLYTKIKNNNGNVEEVWLIPIGNGLKKVVKFEDYLLEIKRLVIQSITKNNYLMEKEKDSYLEEENEYLKYRIYQIDEYLNSGRILPEYKLSIFAKEFNHDIPGISFITKWQRKTGLSKLMKFLTKEISIKLENIIYDSSQNNVMRYYSKLENILFILDNYPEIKNGILSGVINLYEFVLFDRDIQGSFENIIGKKVPKINKPSIETRRSILNEIKKSLKKGLSEKERLKYSILGDILLNNESKRIELLIFDMAEPDMYAKNPISTSDYVLVANKLKKLLEVSSFANDIVLNKISNEQLITIIQRIKNNINEDITNLKQLLKDTRTVRYRKFSIKELNALVSQKQLELQNLNKERSLYSYNGNKQAENNVKTEITRVTDDIEKLQETIMSKIILRYKVRNALLRKYTTIKERVVPQKRFSNVTKDLVFEVIQAYKRNLILKDSPNKVLNVFELHDLNDLSYKFNRVSKQVYDYINNALSYKMGNIDQNYYSVKALETISKKLKVDGTPDLVSIINNWPEVYKEQNVIVDYYGNDLFLKLYKTNDPFDFYNKWTQQEYDLLVKNYTPAKKEVTKVEMVLYNPATRLFGSRAYDGYLFKVYRLEKNISTGLPVIMDAVNLVENPRLGIQVPQRVKYEKPGNTYYMKFPIINPNDPNDTFRWIEVPKGAVGLYPLDYDTCSRFDNKETECVSALGIAGSKCKYKESKCIAEYNLK